MRAASSSSCAWSWIRPLPGVTGTPASAMVRLASSLSPIREITLGLGPTKARPQLSHRAAKRSSRHSRRASMRTPPSPLRSCASITWA